MLAAIAIVLGFKKEIKDKVVGFNSHITLSLANPTSPDNEVKLLTLTPTLAQILDNQDFIESYSLGASIPAVLKTESDFKGIYLKGIDRNSNGRIASRSIEEGNPEDIFSKTDRILISRIAAKELALAPGDSINTFFISDQVRMRPMIVAGIYNTHFDNYDDVFAYAPLDFIRQETNIGGEQGSSIQIMTTNFDSVPEYTSRLDNILSDARKNGLIYQDLNITNALGQGASFFAWLSLLDTNVSVILILMTIVAAVTMISSLLIIITDNTKAIATIKALGADNDLIRRIFIYLSMKIAASGILSGNIFMLSFLWLQDKYHFLHLDAETYYINFVPVEFNWWIILVLNIAVVAAILISLILPSHRIASIAPAVVLKSE